MIALGHGKTVGTIALTGYRYKAFISYSHRDERWGDWLHRSLETYAPPKNLRGRVTPAGPVPRRLAPVFRDKADLPAAGSLNATIVDALRSSQFLIVLASPNALKSKWVNEEIKQFKAFHGSGRVLAVIIGGEPFASQNPNVPDALEAFPEALRFDETESGERIPAEPLAADARKDKDGRSGAIIKLAAGLLGVPLDDLVQREAQRRAQNARRVAGIMGAVAAGMFGIALYANSQRVEAQAQRAEAETQRNEAQRMSAEAEGLIEFMITDLRAEVEQKVGELKTLETLSDRALAYYGRQDKTELDADALGRRARVLHAAGEVNRQRNELGAALKAFRAAAAATEELLARDPDNPDRIFEHAQSVFYVGHVAYQRNDLIEAEKGQREYYRLAERLVAMDPENEKWRLELAYATNNLGALKHRQNEFEEASVFYAKSAEVRKALHERDPTNRRLVVNYAQAISWQALTLISTGNFDSAINLLREELSVYAPLTQEPATDYEMIYLSSVAQRRLATTHFFLGQKDDMRQALEAAQTYSEVLLTRDSEKYHWKLNAARIEILRAEYLSWHGDSETAGRAAKKAVFHSSALLNKAPAELHTRIAFMLASAHSIALNLAGQDTNELLLRLRRILDAETEIASDEALGAYLKVTEALFCSQRSELNAGILSPTDEAALGFITARDGQHSVPTNLRVLKFFIRTGQLERANIILADLEAIGVRHPEITRLREFRNNQSENSWNHYCKNF